MHPYFGGWWRIERVERGGGPFSIEKKYSETRNNKAGERERGAGENSEFGGGALVCVCVQSMLLLMDDEDITVNSCDSCDLGPVRHCFVPDKIMFYPFLDHVK